MRADAEEIGIRQRYQESIVALISSVLFIGASGLVIAIAEDRLVQVFVLLLASVVAAGLFVLVYRLVRPRELELTIDSNQMRYGDAARVSTQKSISRKSVQCD